MYEMQSPPGPETVLDGKRYLYFAGTGYFCLHGHPELIEAACEATRRYGLGSATSRTGFGENPPLREVERRAAEFFAAENAFYFVSGYCGNAILAQGLGDEYDLVLVDELSHYSVFDGVLQGHARSTTFAHRDPESLARKLREELKPGERPLVMSDGVFPISGAIPPAVEYLAVVESYGGGVCLDDAHATGVLGENGRGTFEHLGLFGERLYSSGTLSKALGGHGGIIARDREFLDRVRSRSHLFNGASPPPVPAAAATAKALEIVAAHPEIRRRLWDNVAYFKNGLERMGLEVDRTPVPIICLETGNAGEMEHIQRGLMERGIVIAFTREYAGVGKNGALRIAVFSEHTREMLDRLLAELSALV